MNVPCKANTLHWETTNFTTYNYAKTHKYGWGQKFDWISKRCLSLVSSICKNSRPLIESESRMQVCSQRLYVNACRSLCGSWSRQCTLLASKLRSNCSTLTDHMGLFLKRWRWALLYILSLNTSTLSIFNMNFFFLVAHSDRHSLYAGRILFGVTTTSERKFRTSLARCPPFHFTTYSSSFKMCSTDIFRFRCLHLRKSPIQCT